MIKVSVGEPKTKTFGDFWFDPTTMETRLAVSSAGMTFSQLHWMLIVNTTPPNNPTQIGDVYVDSITLVPLWFDGNRWNRAVPSNYTFPPPNPTIGTLWNESISNIDYIYVNGQWIDYQQAMNAAATPGTTGQTLTSGTLSSPVWQTGQIATPPPSSNDFHIYGANNMLLVTIHMDKGTLTFGPQYTPDAASVVFWQCVASKNPELLENLIDDLIVDLKTMSTKLAMSEDLVQEYEKLVQRYKDAGFTLPEPPKPIDPNESWDRAMGIII